MLEKHMLDQAGKMLDWQQCLWLVFAHLHTHARLTALSLAYAIYRSEPMRRCDCKLAAARAHRARACYAFRIYICICVRICAPAPRFVHILYLCTRTHLHTHARSNCARICSDFMCALHSRRSPVLCICVCVSHFAHSARPCVRACVCFGASLIRVGRTQPLRCFCFHSVCAHTPHKSIQKIKKDLCVSLQCVCVCVLWRVRPHSCVLFNKNCC